jgi:hypothetical protein
MEKHSDSAGKPRGEIRKFQSMERRTTRRKVLPRLYAEAAPNDQLALRVGCETSYGPKGDYNTVVTGGTADGQACERRIWNFR